MSDKARSLTAKERRFVESYCAESKFNATKATIAAGYAPKSARQTATKLLSKCHIQEAIEAFMIEARGKSQITLQSLLSELDEARKAALSAETPQCSAAINATMGKAKLTGLDRVEGERDKKPTPVRVSLRVEDASKDGPSS